MENYTLNYLRWESSKEELGDDCVTFYFEVKPENEEPFKSLIPYWMFKKHLEQMQPEYFKLLQKAEKSCTKWGPNESIYVKELEGYGIDVGKLVVEMAPKSFSIEAEIERNRNLRANPPDLSNFLSDMEDIVVGLKNSNEVYYHLCEELEKTLSRKIVELYPVLVNSSSGYITQLEDILITHIPKLADDLNELISKAEEDAD